MTTPFVYTVKIFDPKSNSLRWYIGSKYARGCSPSDLWASYFTSSKAIRDLLQTYGVNAFTTKIVKIFKDEKSAKEFEEQLVRRAISRGMRLGHELINRNIPNTGWQTMSQAGIPKTKEAMKKMVETRRSRGTYDGGEKHPRARKFTLILKDGTKIEIHGQLKRVCKELNLSWQTLYNNVDKGKIELDRNKYRNLQRLTPAFFNSLGCELKSIDSSSPQSLHEA